jgi:hypothetical protein
MSLAPQSIELCDICGKLRVDAATKQTIILVHGNDAKRATSVCLDCIKRFGFKPIVTVTPEYYEKLLDAADRGMAVREVTE